MDNNHFYFQKEINSSIFNIRETMGSSISKVSRIVLSYFGMPFSFNIEYVYDLHDTKYHRLILRTTYPSHTLSQMNLGKSSIGLKDPIIQLKPSYKFTFRDGHNQLRKQLATHLAAKEQLLEYAGNELSDCILGTYCAAKDGWLDGGSTAQFLVNWLKFSIISGYIAKKIDVKFYEMDEQLHRIEEERKNFRWVQLFNRHKI